MSRSAQSTTGKKSYSRPTLKTYGGITKLTASGSIPGNENAGMPTEMD